MEINTERTMPASLVAKTVLNEIGWDEGITIPVANADNKILEEEASIVFVTVTSVWSWPA